MFPPTTTPQNCHWQDHQWLPCYQIQRSILCSHLGWTSVTIAPLFAALSLTLRKSHCYFSSFTLLTPSQLFSASSSSSHSLGMLEVPRLSSWASFLVCLSLASPGLKVSNATLMSVDSQFISPAWTSLFHSRQVSPTAYLLFPPGCCSR